MAYSPFQLRRLPFGGRLGLSLAVIALLGSYAVSLYYMQEHHKVRVPTRAADEGPEDEPFTLDDLRGAYHGIQSPSPLRAALESGHPSDLEGQQPLDDFTRDELLRWLGDTDQIIANWDNLDWGDVEPAALLDESCATCHSNSADEALRAPPYLDSVADIRAVAFDTDIAPSAEKGVLASIHAHGVALSSVALIAILLLFGTRWPSFLKSLLSIAAGGGLIVDMTSMWLARSDASYIWGIVAGGAAHSAGVCLGLGLVLLDLWLPGGHSEA